MEETERQRKYNQALEKAYSTKIEEFQRFLDAAGASGFCPRCESRMFVMPSIEDDSLCAVATKLREVSQNSDEQAVMPVFLTSCTRCGFIAEHFAAAYAFAAMRDDEAGNDAEDGAS